MYLSEEFPDINIGDTVRIHKTDTGYYVGDYKIYDILVDRRYSARNDKEDEIVTLTVVNNPYPEHPDINYYIHDVRACDVIGIRKADEDDD